MRAPPVVVRVSGLVFACSTGPPPATTPGLLSIDLVLHFKHPYRSTSSPQGTHVAWIWDASGVQNLLVVKLDAGGPAPLVLTSHRPTPRG